VAVHRFQLQMEPVPADVTPSSTAVLSPNGEGQGFLTGQTS